MSTLIGVVGLGHMGSAIQAALSDAGHSVRAYDVDVGAMAAAVERGAVGSNSLAELADACNVVVMSLPDPEQVADVALAPHGVLMSLSPGSTLIDTSTTNPGLSRQLAVAATDVGVDFLDAPLTGRPPTARAFVGGVRQAFVAAEPILDCFTSECFHVGPSGAGMTTKLLLQFTLYSHLVSIARALSVADELGLELGVVAAALKGRWNGTSEFTERFVHAFVRRDYGHEGASVQLIKKDAGLVRDLFGEVGKESPAAELDSLFRRATEAGYERSFFAALREVL